MEQLEITIFETPQNSFTVNCKNTLFGALLRLLQQQGYHCQYLFDKNDKTKPLHKGYSIFLSVEKSSNKLLNTTPIKCPTPLYLGYEIGLNYGSEPLFVKARCDLLLKDVFFPMIPNNERWKIRYVSLPDLEQFEKHGVRDLTHIDCFNISKTPVHKIIEFANDENHMPLLIPRLKLVWQNHPISVPLMTTGTRLLVLIKKHEKYFDCNGCCDGAKKSDSDDYSGKQPVCTCATDFSIPFVIQTPAGKKIEINKDNEKLPLVDCGVVHHSIVFDTHQPCRTPKRKWASTWAYERHPLPYRDHAIYVVKQTFKTLVKKKHQFLPQNLKIIGQTLKHSPSEINQLPFDQYTKELDNLKIDTFDNGFSHIIIVGDFKFHFWKRKFLQLYSPDPSVIRKFSEASQDEQIQSPTKKTRRD